jgi:peptidoglycan hydrolase CwlO-like protein
MNIHFEKEAVQKKKILELDKENEDLAFQLFSKGILIKKLSKKSSPDQNQIATLNEEIKELKKQIDENHAHK